MEKRPYRKAQRQSGSWLILAGLGILLVIATVHWFRSEKKPMAARIEVRTESVDMERLIFKSLEKVKQAEIEDRGRLPAGFTAPTTEPWEKM